MIEYVKGTKTDKAEIIDFLNYVFSQNGTVHDFKKLMPKSYADHVDGLGAEHYLVKENGRIKAVVANRVVEMKLYEKTLKIGLIGNVSVNPYARGSGYMKELLSRALEDAKAKAVDLMLLGGQRQRYAYFGFEHGGYGFRFTLSKANIRHSFADVDISKLRFVELTAENAEALDFAYALHQKREVLTIRSREEFLDIAHTWDRRCRMIYEGARPLGYTVGRLEETVLVDERDYPKVVKALFQEDGIKETDVSVAPYEKERIAFLLSVCENYTLADVEMLNVLNWKKVLEACLLLKSRLTPLQEGELCFSIAGKGYAVTVKGNVPSVEETTDKGAFALTHNQAECMLFGLNGFVFPDENLKNWFPLPFFIDLADTY